MAMMSSGNGSFSGVAVAVDVLFPGTVGGVWVFLAHPSPAIIFSSNGEGESPESQAVAKATMMACATATAKAQTITVMVSIYKDKHSEKIAPLVGRSVDFAMQSWVRIRGGRDFRFNFFILTCFFRL